MPKRKLPHRGGGLFSRLAEHVRRKLQGEYLFGLEGIAHIGPLATAF